MKVDNYKNYNDKRRKTIDYVKNYLWKRYVLCFEEVICQKKYMILRLAMN